jgi:hypothetical protein
VCGDGTACASNADCTDGSSCGATDIGGTAITVDNNQCGTSCTWDEATQSGTCEDDPTRSCFPDSGTITAIGVSEVRTGYYISQIANLLCMPAFSDGLVDQVGGFPGPFLFEARFRVAPRGGP